MAGNARPFRRDAWERGVIASLVQGAVDVAALTARIRAEFPDVAFSHAVLNDEGEDHAVVILDDTWVFRFPRTAERQALFRAELKLLGHIAARSPVAAPLYTRIAPDAAFGGYRMIHGAPMTPETFAALSGPAQDYVLGEIAALLRLIHATPAAVIAKPDGTTARSWTGADYARRYGEEIRARIETFVSPVLLRTIDSFYAAYARAPIPPVKVIVHGDLTDDHMLLAADGERLAGVIDFADAALGDPAEDFTFFWIYGAGAVETLARRYDSTDAGLLERSRWSFARYRIDQLRWAKEGRIGDRGPSEEALMRLLESLQRPSPTRAEGAC